MGFQSCCHVVPSSCSVGNQSRYTAPRDACRSRGAAFGGRAHVTRLAKNKEGITYIAASFSLFAIGSMNQYYDYAGGAYEVVAQRCSIDAQQIGRRPGIHPTRDLQHSVLGDVKRWVYWACQAKQYSPPALPKRWTALLALIREWTRSIRYTQTDCPLHLGKTIVLPYRIDNHIILIFSQYITSKD